MIILPAIKSFLYGEKIHGIMGRISSRSAWAKKMKKVRRGAGGMTELKIPVGISDFAQIQENGWFTAYDHQLPMIIGKTFIMRS